MLQPRDQTSFLELPAEIRNQVYELVLFSCIERPLDVRNVRWFRGQPRHDAEAIRILTRVCRSIREDMLNLYFARTPFWLGTYYEMRDLVMEDGGVQFLKAIRLQHHPINYVFFEVSGNLAGRMYGGRQRESRSHGAIGTLEQQIKHKFSELLCITEGVTVRLVTDHVAAELPEYVASWWQHEEDRYARLLRTAGGFYRDFIFQISFEALVGHST
jgi:hypothetical protein